MLGIIKGFIYMVFVLILAQVVNFFYSFIVFYFKKKHINNDDKDLSLNMVQCDKCKVYISKSEAFYYDGKFFCKKDHV